MKRSVQDMLFYLAVKGYSGAIFLNLDIRSCEQRLKIIN